MKMLSFAVPSVGANMLFQETYGRYRHVQVDSTGLKMVGYIYYYQFVSVGIQGVLGGYIHSFGQG